MITLLRNISSLVTVNTNGKNYKIGQELNDIGEIKNGAMLFSDKILWLGEDSDADNYLISLNIRPDEIIDMTGMTILPGFVDSHTHIVFAGDRSREFGRRLQGVTYKQIAEEGGGIQTTVKATRNADIDKLYQNGEKLLISAIKHGTTSFEIKSGYSLTTEGEINQLKAIRKLKENFHCEIKSTFLGAHDFPIEYREKKQAYIDLLCHEMIPKVAEMQLADYCDAFVDDGYYTIEQGREVLLAAKNHGLKVRLHADELADVSAGKLAAEMGCLSADHLLFVSDESLDAMKDAGTVACLLPGTAYFIRMPYADARNIIDKGLITAIATDTNPGSSFTENMQMILSLSVINMKMSAEEAISAATINGAYSIEIADSKGSLEIGKDADFAVYDCGNYADIMYHFGINQVIETRIKGKKF
ncbi:MAG: imidazolonepropionase [Candidatus Kapabacteria bacterium]|nr:imidazolonepropionase [Ignavibacteriota bacterium]MCW5884660.1 imidazolonepropionase [Candidatus Kapabacteria bacterium]